jgi:DNA-binding NarL/FixJ family response regulator
MIANLLGPEVGMATTTFATATIRGDTQTTACDRKTRVLVADDHSIILHGLCELLNASAHCQVVAVATTGSEAVSKAAESEPDVVVLDINMPLLNGIEATREIRRNLPNTEVLILTAYESELLANAILCAGARGYLLKSDTVHDLVFAVESLGRGRPFFSTSLAQRILDGYLQQCEGDTGTDLTPGLTPSERQILQLLAEGYCNKEIAVQQGITVKTAETHRANIMRKLKLRSVSDVVHFAVRNQIIQA